MALARQSCGSVWIPKLLGAYEAELIPVIEQIVNYKPDLVVDVGSAEGYFAAGFALRIPAAKVIAVDTNPFARSGVRAMSRTNGLIGRIKTKGWINHETLQSVTAAAVRPVVWCDIEGGEGELLKLDRVPSLKKALMVIEEHQHASGIHFQTILDHFAQTHNSEIVRQTERRTEDWIPSAIADTLDPGQAALALNELRPPGQVWLILRPRK